MAKDNEAFSQMYLVKPWKVKCKPGLIKAGRVLLKQHLVSLTIGFSEVMMLKNNFMIVKDGLLKQLSIVVKY